MLTVGEKEGRSQEGKGEREEKKEKEEKEVREKRGNDERRKKRQGRKKETAYKEEIKKHKHTTIQKYINAIMIRKMKQEIEK